MNKNKYKEKYIEYAEKTFKGRALELVLNNIELFYDDTQIINKNKYGIGCEVKLAKGTYIHGIPGMLENFDWIIENGFLAVDFTGAGEGKNKIKNSIGMWNIQQDCTLREYIIKYSGITITYTIGRGPWSEEISELVPYHKFDEYTENINNDDRIWTYWGEKTKEVTFLPSLVSDKRQIAFILNMESEYAKKMAYADVWNTQLSAETIEDFLDYRYYPKFLDLRFKKNAVTTDRESAVMFGLPLKLAEGVFVGRKIENDKKALSYIKSKLPDAYICGLDGRVIM
jgi:hypothetical protein